MARRVFIVDDNLIGNKKAIKPILRDIVAWQSRNGYPMTSSPKPRSISPTTTS